MDKATQKLQKLIKNRKKTSIVISAQKDFKPYKRKNISSSSNDYYASGFDNN